MEDIDIKILTAESTEQLRKLYSELKGETRTAQELIDEVVKDAKRR